MQNQAGIGITYLWQGHVQFDNFMIFGIIFE